VGFLLGLAGYVGGQLGGAEVVELFWLVQVARVALRLGQNRDDLVGFASGVLVGAASLAPRVHERGLAGCTAHEGAVVGCELQGGQLVGGGFPAEVRGFGKQIVYGVAH